MKRTVLLAGIGFVCCAHAAEIKYTSAQTVADQLTGADTSVVIDVQGTPYSTTTSGRSGWTGIVEFTNANDFGGNVTVTSGAVKVSNVRALGTAGRIKMYPHTAIIIAVSFNGETGGLKGQIIDRIDVMNPEGLAEPDMWVSFQVEGDGLNNNVNFSSQEHLWLSSPRSSTGWQNNWNQLVGTFTPYGSTYKFGYNFLHYKETVALQVNNLSDVNGSCSVIFRGPSTQVIGSGSTFTGKIRIEDGAWVHFNGDTGLGPVPGEERADQITISGSDCALGPRCAGKSFNANIGITVEDGAELKFVPSGVNSESSVNVFNGPICGSGDIVMIDHAGFRFASAHNTFDGNVQLYNSGIQHFIIGTGGNFSWGGGSFTFGAGATDAAPQKLILDSNTDVVFSASVSGAGKIEKRGAGRITCTQAAMGPEVSAVSGGYVLGASSDVAIPPTAPISGGVGMASGVKVRFSGEYGCASTNWTFVAGDTNGTQARDCHVDVDGVPAFELTDGVYKWENYKEHGAITLKSPVDVAIPWTMSFSVRCVEPWGDHCGDAFAVLFQSLGTTATGDGLRNPTGTSEEKAIGVTDAWGVLMYSSGGQFCWVKDKKISDTNSTVANNMDIFYFDRWKTNPLNVSLVFDGTRLTATFACGSATWTTVNAQAGSELAAAFPSGAYLSLMTRQTAWHAKTQVMDFQFNHTGVSGDATPTLSGGVSFVGGTSTWQNVGVAKVTVAGSVSVSGTSALVWDSLAPVDFTAMEWTFDFTEGNPSLTLPASIRLPATIAVSISGKINDSGWVEVLDATGYLVAGGELPTIACDGRHKVDWASGRLRVKNRGGMVFVLR